MLKRIFLTLLVAGGAAYAQTYYLGILGGYGAAPDLTVKNSTGSATAGLNGGAVVGAVGGGDTSKYWGGEMRYMCRFGDLKLASNGTEVDFGAHTHIITGDLLRYFTPRESSVRPYISFGGGMRILVGVGAESAAQPLGNFAALTATREMLAVGDFGLGLKFKLGKSTQLRLEVRDYVGPAPSKVIAPNVGSKISGVFNDVIAMAVFSYSW
ncbi:MAG: hypothetical protein ABSC08_19490 [Bryobacteraceae bacterium]|jgi:hypothetical protein